ncbi:hypothetical protein [Helicobacter burdigaliensis]|uniref:hypothetical protein n=1 Tax=Helicobacter burdigaliensis TaxID=2315334 RepID=UPI001E3AC5AF|nr:hypothetical protein [Helicobacter burdigaliensis]
MQNLEKLLQELNKKIELSNQLNYCNLMSNIIAESEINKGDKQILLLLLQDRDRNYIRINHNDQVFENIAKYLKLIQPLAVPDEELVRVGGKGDGGYVMYNKNLAGGGA